MTPDTLGLIPEQEVRRLAGFGKAIGKYFSNPIGSATVSDGSSGIYKIKLDQKDQVNLIVLEENIASGQRIKSYHVEAKIDDRWIRIAAGESIGRKRIQQIELVEAAEYRVALFGDAYNNPLRSFTLYLSDL
jgi:alpha-L-fucosidase